MAINNRGDTQQFNYTGSVQTFTVTRAGLYKLEVYGGRGGGNSSATGYGRNGGYSVGYKYLNVGDVLYIVNGGGNNNRYNGGGACNGTSYSGHGGGATHIATVTGTLASIGSANLDKILIIAGGGGGGAESDEGGTTKYGGYGGGSSGGTASGGNWNGLGGLTYQRTTGYQNQTNQQSHPEVIGKFGVGGDAEYGRTSGAYYAGGGGGGYYGGGGGGWSTSKNDGGAGGGGSGYIGGVPEITFNGTTYSSSTSQNGGSGNGWSKLTLEDVEFPYEITLDYDNTLGTASYEWGYQRDEITLTATPNTDAQFLGWYINSVKVSGSTPFVYQPSNDITIEARFEPIYEITTSVEGNGAIQFTRGTDQNDITVSVIPDANWHFVKYTVDGTDATTTPLQLHLTQDISITAYFEEDDKFHISCPTGHDNMSVYISANDVYSGTQVTLWARPFPDYSFVKWGDNITANPRTITVTENVTLSAIYQRITDTNGIYQYRCFIKDQLHMTDPPKSFMVVDTFDINTDLLTNATSKITVIETPTNVNEGDVLVLYDPKGTFLYNGVITSFSDKTINCSQMQSYYRGSWVYQTSSKTYLEQEIATILGDYAQGKMKGSSYTDTLVAQRLGGITIDYVGSITSHLPTHYDAKSDGSQYEVIDMEEFIYELYQRYSIIFDFEINFSGTNYVHIKVPTYQKIAVGNNMYAVQDMSPVTEVEETNRLIIYSSNNTYRTTYVATKTGIVQAPSSTANRFNVTNTEIVFSDDALADLVSANLPNTMYNHKVTFNLVIKNFLYEFGEFNLGGELDVYYNDDYYSTVLTGYRISKASNQNITGATFTCGKVRYALTKMLTMGVI